ncbi:hypothetical protein [Flagellimonas nanhaiensis]|uniref:Uncharacterized protein n=1 Tax=Flagellimonas nanhaiensis TaxID=2292706 RepID=A0A371JPF5_9FLAO|nr:hypothetical protein [Allomuricauda nanhaiensis]RDY59371.1 hypothetical protein DX873_08245 [Allomuricauda nanhaiensis]
MKNIYRSLTFLMVFAGILSCEDEEKIPYLHAPELESGAYFRNISNGGLMNKLDFEGSSYSVTGELISKNVSDVSSIDFIASFVDNTVESETDDVNLVDPVVLESVDPSTLTTNSNGFPEKTFEATGDEVLLALGIDPANVEGGDAVVFSIVIKMANGTVFSSSNTGDSVRGELFFNSPLDYSSTIVCILSEVPAGDWVVEMEDSYPDGWQTSTENGGPGITVTLNTGDVFEVGLCSPFEQPSYDCTSELGSGSATVTIPPGITSADWYFPGDIYGEISYRIYAPSGNLVASYTASGPAQGGPISLNLCEE